MSNSSDGRSDAGEPNFYADPDFDRAGHLRRDEAWLADARKDPANRAVPLWQTRNLVIAGERPKALFPSLAELPSIERTSFLGLSGGLAYFAADLSDLAEEEAARVARHFDSQAAFLDLRQVGVHLPRAMGALLAYARGLSHWHGRQRSCGVCGFPTEITSAGHVLACTNPACATQHFPRTDPATIVLVHDGARCLLGRQPHWPPGMYSTLAGFVEPGESLEDAVRREVFEESGVRVGEVTYHSSQPWPFPQSLMLGFSAKALTTEIRIDNDELEDARWFTVDELRRLPELGFHLPRGDSIARRLIENWLSAQL
jgi:NAD+ diphosphatase